MPQPDILVVDQPPPDADSDADEAYDAFELSPQKIKSSEADAARAFYAAEAASAATAHAVTSAGVKPEQLAERLVSGSGCGASSSSGSDQMLPVCDRIAACHRLNEHFAACASYDEAVLLAGKLCKAQPRLGEALVSVMVDGDALVELAVQLMHSLCVHDAGAKMLEKAGVLPVLAMSLRADEPLLRTHGLTLLATLAERPEMAVPLVKAGAIKLVCFLGRTLKGEQAEALWPLMLEVIEGILRAPKAVPEAQQKMLRATLGEAGLMHKCISGTREDVGGTLPLALPDGRRLTRLLVNARALAMVAPSNAAPKAK